MHYINTCALAIFLALSIACGKSEAQKQAEEAAQQAQKAAEAMQKAVESSGAAAAQGGAAAAQGMEAFAKAMQAAATAAGGAGPDGKPVDPIGFQQLETVLPTVSGWDHDKPRGEKMTMPVPFSQTEATYKNGDAEVEVKIVDSAFSQLLVAPWAMFLSAGYEKQTSEGYEKSVNVGGNPGFEKWNTDSKDGELNLVVAKRFLVTIEGRDIKDPSVMHDFASKLDTGKLAGFK